VAEATPRNTRKGKCEEIIDDLEPEVPRIGLITRPRSVKTLTHRKDASEKTQKEFLSRSVPLLDFWGDFMGFFLLSTSTTTERSGKVDSLPSSNISTAWRTATRHSTFLTCRDDTSAWK
jgi:hypothetical protein